MFRKGWYNIEVSENAKINDKYNMLNKEYKMAKKQILEDKIKIINLIGEKGEINSKEFKL